MRGDLARSHAKAVRGSAQELMHKWPCMVGATALERLQTHSFVILVHVKVINFYTVPFLIDVLSDFPTHSQLYLGCMEPMDRLFCYMWWWHAPPDEDSGPGSSERRRDVSRIALRVTGLWND